ncbi:UDP-N-acetylmuramoyl-L-alanyl-D-glutamate--2,6-diaminopimelate ligase [Thermoleophilum album]|uniref:UDP-N-acetylmuramoyl-L-alanyl-D-glutamate--2, 6-diaminopimelate ligase n=1 Tax=Thermoleophilum album TaxID=29539 RepID=UPI00237CFC61|nr:UDP-N-acetylmuramoyl-L-alanyl-D-glutamate--2,6-diaminopimelate ligase [Thermoleophilum album]WDT94366.1 UDP-N-acetylmuramoyl-L-alanyl-D-glutamate--2,6-diaminopimelate ligase [Thermoleophilum album]
MDLRRLAEGVAREFRGAGAETVTVSALAYDSRRVRPGTLFFCVPGMTTDGHRYAGEAVARGAVALVCERPLELPVPQVVVADARAAMAAIAVRFYGDPTARLRVVGITGTNGKTTTAFLVRHLLESMGVRCGLLGTVAQIVGGEERPPGRTTPESLDLQATFAEMVAAGDRACAIEVSSHALELGRVAGTRFACRVFTNLSQDHLDFHGTMELYFEAKRRLFSEFAGAAVIGVDCEWGRRLAREFPHADTFAVERDATLRARDVEFDIDGARFTLEAPEGSWRCRLPLPGRFNVENALAALGAVRALGGNLAQAAAALATFDRVPGRFERIDAGQPFAVLVDYAHTPDSLARVLAAARPLCRGRLWCVFGCGGDRDRGKRPQMGRIAAELADRVIVTSDNPRSEDPEAIIDEIVAGVSGQARARLERESDRRRAIERAIAAAEPGDLVLIAGKGHEQGQEFADGRVEPFDDREVAREALAARAGAAA